MKKQTIGMAICAATFFALSGGSVTSWAESTPQKSAKADKKGSKKKHSHAHTCKECGKPEKDCTCEDKKHEGDADEHKGHAH